MAFEEALELVVDTGPFQFVFLPNSLTVGCEVVEMFGSKLLKNVFASFLSLLVKCLEGFHHAFDQLFSHFNY